MSSDDLQYVDEFIDSLFPMSPEGYNFDLFVSNADVTNYNLEAISVPTLIAHTRDDQLASHEASQRAAARIPGARFVSLESGGHLMLGQMKIVGDQLAEFFAERRDRRTGLPRQTSTAVAAAENSAREPRFSPLARTDLAGAR